MIVKANVACEVQLGGVAQLGERVVRNDEAEGSNPFTSTNFSSKRDSRRP